MYISIEKLDFSYSNNHEVLKDLSIGLPKGKTLSIIGSSGSGKSTLLRLIGGLITENKKNIYQGKIHINGQNPEEFIKNKKTGFMFQEPVLFPNLNVEQNIALPVKLKRDIKLYDYDLIIKTVGLEQFKYYFPHQLSGGMKTRVELARNFISSPDLLLLDEPFSALDTVWKYKLYTEMESLKQQSNTTVIIVTHDIQEAILLSDSIAVLGDNGKITYTYDLNKFPKVSERLKNISEYLNSVYDNYYLKIQEDFLKK